MSDFDAACNPMTPAEELRRIWYELPHQGDAVALRKAVAGNPNISTEMAMDIVYWRDHRFIFELLHNPAMPLWMLEHFDGWHGPALVGLVHHATALQWPLAETVKQICDARFPPKVAPLPRALLPKE